MEQYVSAMGRGRTREAVREMGWRLLLNPTDMRDPEDLPYALDNGAWNAFQVWMDARKAEGLTEDQAMALWLGGRWREGMLDLELFEAALETYGARADWVVLPDIVAIGEESLALSTRWMNRCLGTTNLVLIAVQDGMEPDHLAPFVGRSVGIFLGGSTGWKEKRMIQWGEFCAEKNCHYHVARVNTARRYRMATAAGATSTDGTSGTKFRKTMQMCDDSRRRRDLFAPTREVA